MLWPNFCSLRTDCRWKFQCLLFTSDKLQTDVSLDDLKRAVRSASLPSEWRCAHSLGPASSTSCEVPRNSRQDTAKFRAPPKARPLFKCCGLKTPEQVISALRDVCPCWRKVVGGVSSVLQDWGQLGAGTGPPLLLHKRLPPAPV